MHYQGRTPQQGLKIYVSSRPSWSQSWSESISSDELRERMREIVAAERVRQRFGAVVMAVTHDGVVVEAVTGVDGHCSTCRCPGASALR